MALYRVGWSVCRGRWCGAAGNGFITNSGYACSLGPKLLEMWSFQGPSSQREGLSRVAWPHRAKIELDVNVVQGIVRSGKSGQDSGYSEWLGAFGVSVNTAIASPPWASMKQYVYKSALTVKTGGAAGLEIVPAKLSTSARASRTDIQHMKITIHLLHFDFARGQKANSSPRRATVVPSRFSTIRATAVVPKARHL